jgi:hypothetical protein
MHPDTLEIHEERTFRNTAAGALDHSYCAQSHSSSLAAPPSLEIPSSNDYSVHVK